MGESPLTLFCSAIVVDTEAVGNVTWDYALSLNTLPSCPANRVLLPVLSSLMKNTCMNSLVQSAIKLVS